MLLDGLIYNMSDNVVIMRLNGWTCGNEYNVEVC